MAAGRAAQQRRARPTGHARSEPHNGAPTPRITTVLVIGVPVAIACIVFANTLWNDLLYDDRPLTRLPDLTLATMWSYLPKARGLTYIVHMADNRVWGDWIPGFHLTNVLLHAIATALATLAALVLTSSRRIALLCGCFFAVHPVHTETVASIAYRKDILAMTFGMLALIVWVRASRRIWGYLAALALLAAAFSSKEVAAVGIVPMLFAADLIPREGVNDDWRSRLRVASLRFLPFLVAAIAATLVVISYVGFESGLQAIRHASNGELTDYGGILGSAIASFPKVTQLLFFPLALSPDYPMPLAGGDVAVMVGVMLLLIWVTVIARLARKLPLASFALLWVLATYLPISNVVPVSHIPLAERYLYVPSFGVCLLLGIVAAKAVDTQRQGMISPRRVAIALTVAVIGLAAARSVVRNLDWRDDVALWSSALENGFDTHRVHFNMGRSLLKERRTKEGLDHCVTALRIHPCDQLRGRLGNLLGRELVVALEAGRVDTSQVQIDWQEQ